MQIHVGKFLQKTIWLPTRRSNKIIITKESVNKIRLRINNEYLQKESQYLHWSKTIQAKYHKFYNNMKTLQTFVLVVYQQLGNLVLFTV